jgi:hypothetical protein
MQRVVVLRLDVLGSVVPDRPHTNDKRCRRAEADVVAVKTALVDGEVTETGLDLDWLLRVAEISASEGEISAQRTDDRS